MVTTSNRIPGYSVWQEITRTDRAIVYEAVNCVSGDAVALKLVRNDKHGHHEIEMLQRVARRTSDGPVHVMHLLDTYEDGDELWLALEYFNATLEVLDHEQMTPLALMSISSDSVNGLVEMRRAGIVDDDVKPANLAFKSRSGRVAHLDLGCARRAGEIPVGYTAEYAAPEVRRGETSDTSPCYGWARTMEYIATGRIGLGPDYLVSDFSPWVGEDFAHLVARCCEPTPQDRPSVKELSANINSVVAARVRCRHCEAVLFDGTACPNCKSYETGIATRNAPRRRRSVP